MEEDEDILALFPPHEIDMDFKAFEASKEIPDVARQLLPKDLFKIQKIPSNFKVPFHTHELRVADGRHWGCDGRHNSWGCLSINEGTSYKEAGRWRCEECDFDCCRKCME